MTVRPEDRVLVDALLPRIAAELGLEMVAPLRGGEFGATIVRDREGQELVLKASPSPAWTRRSGRSARLVERLRNRGYPAPMYVASGATALASWSLQERLPGATALVMTEPHALRLIELLALHADAAPRRRQWTRAEVPKMRGWLRKLARRGDAGQLCEELRAVLAACGGVSLRDRDIIHNDFSHRNYLASGERVTGVIDWELAATGDWRLDLCSLAYDAALDPDRVPERVATMLTERVRRACPPRVLALFLAYQALRHVDFEARAHPERVASTIEDIGARIAPLWRRAEGVWHAAA